jgi:tRNA U34 5-carboxymethylaminomethyl modifying enzyme MnmG/GidA
MGALRTRAAILTTGTFLRGAIFVGEAWAAGVGRARWRRWACRDRSPSWVSVARLKSGTPCRLSQDDRCRWPRAQPGDDPRITWRQFRRAALAAGHLHQRRFPHHPTP